MQIENEREFNDALIQDREMGIKQIETSIAEVNEIFTDLANLVHEQGFQIGVFVLVILCFELMVFSHVRQY